MKLVDLTGKRFGMLVVTERTKLKGKASWFCRCDCGKEIIVSSQNLKNRKNLSCGCKKIPSKQLKDMTGKRFGMLTVIKRTKSPAWNKGNFAWLCRCDCGGEIVAPGVLLRRGYYSSCGCTRAQKLHDVAYKHGMSNTKLYDTWRHMLNRCYCKSYPERYLYGDRGITVCDEWKHNFLAFAEWAKANGYEETLTLDRIDNDKGYSPENCRWATIIEQANNKRNNHRITYNGETHTIAEWSRIKNLSYSCLKSRIKLNWPTEKALETPPRGRLHHGHI